MTSAPVEWSCPQCRSGTADQRKYCTDCHSMLHWTFNGSGRSGSYKNYCRHRGNCNYCIVNFEEEKQQEFEEKNNAIKQGFEALNNGK